MSATANPAATAKALILDDQIGQVFSKKKAGDIRSDAELLRRSSNSSRLGANHLLGTIVEHGLADEYVEGVAGIIRVLKGVLADVAEDARTMADQAEAHAK